MRRVLMCCGVAAAGLLAIALTAPDAEAKTYSTPEFTINMGEGFTFGVRVSHNSDSNQLAATGKIRWTKFTLFTSTVSGETHGDTLRIERHWNGASGLRVYVLLEFTRK